MGIWHTALRGFLAVTLFAAERLRMGILAIAAILLVKLVGAYWLPNGAAPAPGPGAGPVVSAAIR